MLRFQNCFLAPSLAMAALHPSGPRPRHPEYGRSAPVALSGWPLGDPGTLERRPQSLFRLAPEVVPLCTRKSRLHPRRRVIKGRRRTVWAAPRRRRGCPGSSGGSGPSLPGTQAHRDVEHVRGRGKASPAGGRARRRESRAGRPVFWRWSRGPSELGGSAARGKYRARRLGVKV